MTPNIDSPYFIRHEVPDYACENSKNLSVYFTHLKNQASKGRWRGLSENDFTLTYNTDDGRTEVYAILTDTNNHSHHLSLCLVPDNGFGNTDDDRFHLSYCFEGTFMENTLFVRSFATYLATYLCYEGFEPTLVKCDKGIWIESSNNDAYEEFCRLIDITISHLKPMEWFYSKEPTINSFEEAYCYLEGVKTQLQSKARKNRWKGVSPECFKIQKYETEEEASLFAIYRAKDVWDIHLGIDIADCKSYIDMFCNCVCYFNAGLSEDIIYQLDALFASFISTLKISKDHMFIGAGRKDHSISIQYFYIEDTFEIFCKILDEIVHALQNFTFQLPLQPINLTEEIETIKEQMEVTLNTTFEVVTEEEQINKKLRCGYFKT